MSNIGPEWHYRMINNLIIKVEKGGWGDMFLINEGMKGDL